MVVTRDDIFQAARRLGVAPGDTVLIHSSLKSFGYVEGGAEAVISAFEAAVGDAGTLVFPTLCQKDFARSYETWHMDKPSDVGYLTNYFRLRQGSLRSNQATHSVAASGKDARWLTETHGDTGRRFGEMGDTPFSADSPWEKLYRMDAKVILLGVDSRKTTLRHLAEYIYIDECLRNLEGCEEFEVMRSRIAQMNIPGVWPHVECFWVENMLEQQGKVTRTQCGGSHIMCFSAKEFVETSLKMLRQQMDEGLREIEPGGTEAWLRWRRDMERIMHASR